MSQSTADYPLFIQIKTIEEFVKKSPIANSIRGGWRMKPYSMICDCAWVDTLEDRTVITLFIPKPEWCTCSHEERTIKLINHEIQHSIFEDFDSDEGDEASELWDSSWMLKQQARMNDTYCWCQPA